LSRPRAERIAVEARFRVVFPAALRRDISAAAPGQFGRQPDEGITVLDHPTISRRHLAWDAASVRDLGSRNGSWLDGVKLGSAELHDGAVVRIGDVLLVYEEGSAEDEPGVSRDAVPGESVAMARLRRELARAATDAAPLLLVGETGTGKERIAGEAHRLSARKGPLLSVNCAALSPHLVESQLFGHVKGAFTGAGDAQPGLFRAAQGGTLFLDEIGELPLEIQPKLLRAIQEREVLSVGATKPARVDVRVVGATHRDLGVEAEAGRFRRDLYARLSLWELRVPPLRARRGDLLEWLKRLDALHRRERGRSGELELSADAAEALLLAEWPLNLRALDRLVRQFADLGHPLRRDELPAWLFPDDAAAAPAAASVPKPAVPTREEFESAYRELNGSVRALARKFQRDRRQIYRWLEQYGLKERG
jgi:DNA-binding NtrC family response regulator